MSSGEVSHVIPLGPTLPNALAYIDPGTGSMLFTLLIGVSSAAYFFFRRLAIRAKFALSGGRAQGEGERHAFVIFSDDKRYWNVFKPICDEFEWRGIDACYWTASPDDPALAATYEHVTCEFIGEENKAFARLNTMSADVVLATTPGLQVYQWKRSKDVSWYAHILHATSTAAWYRMFGIDFFDAVLLSNEYQVGEVRELERVREIPAKELPLVGCSYMDSMAERRDREGLPMGALHTGDDITVLLAPTWGPNGLLTRYGTRIIDALVKTGFRIVVRPHPQSMKSERKMMGQLMAAYPDGEAVEWNFDNDNFSVLARSDVLISDISGVIHDFALIFDRPVLYAPGGIDAIAFDASWLDEPFWESPIFTDTGIAFEESQFGDLRQVILDVMGDEEVAARRQRVRQESWLHQGECARRTVDYLVSKRIQLLDEQRADAVE